MVTEIENVKLIYTEADSRRAEEIHAFLKEKLAGDNKPPQKAAVILISDAAAEDKEGWQKIIAGLGDDVRKIPVGRTENANFKKDVPDQIREINYIRADDSMLDNILDSLMIDSDFYRMRSEVILQRASGRIRSAGRSAAQTKCHSCRQTACRRWNRPGRQENSRRLRNSLQKAKSSRGS